MNPDAENELYEKVEELKMSRVRHVIANRLREFKEAGEGSTVQLFNELCFCILTANFNAERSIRIQRDIEDGFMDLSESALTERLRQLGHRFPASRAKYIVHARKFAKSLKNIVNSLPNAYELRQWLIRNVKGIGYKESSHFLRNIGYTDLAIVDFHIIEVLVRHGLIERPVSLNRDRYLQIEALLKTIAERSCLTLSELDLYLWYMETGKVLK